MDGEAMRVVLRGSAPRRRASRLNGQVRVIRELRRRGYSFREIVEALHERCGVRVGLHTLHHFVRTRVTIPRRTSARRRVAARTRPSAIANTVSITAEDAAAARNRVVALKQRAAASVDTVNKEFHFDENEPLRLMSDRAPHTR